MNQDKIGKFIRDLRTKNNLTQNDLAEKLGVSNMAVSKWENGKNIPDIEILMMISKLFNVEISDILNGEISTKKKESNAIKNSKKKIIYIGIILLILLIILVLIFIFIDSDSEFQFKTLTSNCEEFNVTGSMAYSSDKTSIYISNIDYCGADEDKIYDKLECTLFEDYNGKKREISKCASDSNVSLSSFLENVKIGVDNYEASCKKYTSSNLYLEIKGYEKNKTVTYNVPITMNDSCSLN